MLFNVIFCLLCFSDMAHTILWDWLHKEYYSRYIWNKKVQHKKLVKHTKWDIWLNKFVFQINLLIMQFSHCRIILHFFFGNFTSLLCTCRIWLVKGIYLSAYLRPNPSRFWYAVVLTQSIFTLVHEKADYTKLWSVQRSRIDWANLIQSGFILCDNSI